MKITISHSLKLPHPDPSIQFGSIGASVSIETEPPPDIQGDREKLRQYARALLAEAKARTEEHLEQQTGKSAQRGSAPEPRRSHRPMNGRGNGRANGAAASSKQLNYLRSLANEQRLGYQGLRDLAMEAFGKDVLHLSKREASSLIEELRGADSNR